MMKVEFSRGNIGSDGYRYVCAYSCVDDHEHLHLGAVAHMSSIYWRGRAMARVSWGLALDG